MPQKSNVPNSNSTKSLIYFLFVLRIKINETYEFISVLILILRKKNTTQYIGN